MLYMSWTRAVHITQWAATKDAHHNLPLLVRRLIRSTASPHTKITFPAGEQVNRPGFDGTVETPKGNEYVPDGLSRWEMGVDQKVKSKADDDFAKRTASTPLSDRQKTTF